jgi:acetyltransferase-like isoleucine patch superfamily enzyme
VTLDQRDFDDMLHAVEFDAGFIAYLDKKGVALAPPGVFPVHEHTVLEAPMSLYGIEIWGSPATIGAFTYFGSGHFFNAEIGRYCSVGGGLRVGATRHPTGFLSSSPITYMKFINFESYFASQDPDWRRTLPGPVPFEFRPRTKIGNDVWIGADVFIKDGVTVGDGAIIGAHAVVTHDVEPYAIVGGNPARVIRKRFPDAIVERLISLRWWRFNMLEFSDVDVRDVAHSISRIEDLVASGALKPYAPEKVNIVKAYQDYRASDIAVQSGGEASPA